MALISCVLLARAQLAPAALLRSRLEWMRSAARPCCRLDLPCCRRRRPTLPLTSRSSNPTLAEPHYLLTASTYNYAILAHPT